MAVDRRAFITSLGGTAAVSAMSHEARADALEDYLSHQLDEQVAANQGVKKYPTVSELETQIESRSYRRGAGSLFTSGANGGTMKQLAPLPAKPTLLAFFRGRFNQQSNHVLQSATRALKTGMTEEVILACLLHDVVQSLIKVDHGWWGAQLFEPYIPEKATFAIRYHQALRFYAVPELAQLPRRRGPLRSAGRAVKARPAQVALMRITSAWRSTIRRCRRSRCHASCCPARGPCRSRCPP